MVMVTVPKFAITWVNNEYVRTSHVLTNVNKSFTNLRVDKQQTNKYIRTIKNKTNKQKENKYDKSQYCMD